MNREEERNMIAHEIAWQHTKHYDPLLSKESWCEMAAREAIDWADEHPKKGLVDIEKVCDYLKNLGYQRYPGAPMERIIDDDELENLINAMEE